MQAFYKRFSVVSGFLVLLIVLVINGLVIRRQLGVQVEDQAWVAHTRQVMLQLADTESLLKDAETGQRGYLYAGKAEYLTPYNAAAAQIEEHLQELTALTADNPGQQTRIFRPWFRMRLMPSALMAL